MIASAAAVVVILAIAQGASAQFATESRLGSSCSAYEWRCNNKQCIPVEGLCDGLRDCLDGSDETREECSKPDSQFCGPRAFRCDYGACVDGDAPCNGKKDCADNSDETLPRCKNNQGGNQGDNQGGGGGGGGGFDGNTGYGNLTECNRSQFRCDNGQCIDSAETCDGAVDCFDRSDETVLRCGSYNCPQYVFRCAYGACIDIDLKCNGEINCADGSDEDPKLCGFSPPSRPPTQRPPTQPTQRPPIDDPYNVPQGRPTTQKPPTRPTQRPTITTTTRRPSEVPPLIKEACDVPGQPLNGEWQLEKSQCTNAYRCEVPQGVYELDPGTQLVYRCDKGYKLNGSADVFCGRQGKWSNVPVCEEIRCKPLSDATRDAQCTYDDNWVSCDSSTKPGTRAQLSCRNSYRQDTADLTYRDTVRCNAAGEWEPKPIVCVPVCGVLATGSGSPLIVNGSAADVAEFPWHATLYMMIKQEKQFICGATIVKDNLLVTAAHCIYDTVAKKPHKPSLFYVATGNIFRDYDYADHDFRVVKRSRVKSIYMNCQYLDNEGNYGSDIAVLELVTPFVFSAVTMPACLDTIQGGDQAVLEPGNYGKLAGFGRTAVGANSFILQTISLPYVSLSECKAAAAESDNMRYLTIDKFCAGYRNGSSVCDGDSGGGLVFKTDNKWYLRGIVSIGIGVLNSGGEKQCDPNQYALYTKVSTHSDWIQSVIIDVENPKQSFRHC